MDGEIMDFKVVLRLNDDEDDDNNAID